MSSFLLIVLAIASRILPHSWLNFTAVGGSLVYFGARRPLRESVVPLALLMMTDYYLTVFVYNYAFHVQGYLLTWVWYVAAIVLGSLLLRDKVASVVSGRRLCCRRLRSSPSATSRYGQTPACIPITWQDWVPASWPPCPSIATICSPPASFWAWLSGFPHCSAASPRQSTKPQPKRFGQYRRGEPHGLPLSFAAHLPG